jgi:DNA-binding PadR family transcriptional regulator
MEQPTLRMTQVLQQVLRVMLADPDAEPYGAELIRFTGLTSSAIVHIMARLVRVGIIARRVEDIDPAEAGRPARTYYSFAPGGAERARAALARADQDREARMRTTGRAS